MVGAKKALHELNTLHYIGSRQDLNFAMYIVIIIPQRVAPSGDLWSICEDQDHVDQFTLLCHTQFIP